MLPRLLEHTIRRAIRTFPAAIVTGPRQSGKTTLLRECWSTSHRYLSLENPDVRARALSDPIAFLRDNPPPAILDEIQYAPQLLSYIKSAIDSDRSAGNWLLTGSQNFGLMQGVSQSLAGRAAVLTLLPFSAGEAGGRDMGGDAALGDVLARLHGRRAAGQPPGFSLAESLLRGSYPELWANPLVDRDIWCASYVQTYLERDVRQVVNVGDLNTFERFLRLAAARTGQVINFAELGRDAGVSQPTARKWMSVLEASGQVYLLQPYFRNFGKRLIRSPKLYWLDAGVASYLMGLHSAGPLMHGPFWGPIFETAVVGSWIKAFVHRGLQPQLYYWRSRDGLEVDLLVEYEGSLHPFEMKATATPVPMHASSLQKWMALPGNTAREGVVLADVAEPVSLAPGLRAVPWWWV